MHGTAAGGEELAGNPYFSNTLHSGGGSGDTLRGGAAVDSLHDDGGQATLIGGAGGDSYYITGNDDILVELPNYGRDTVYAPGDYTLGAELEDLVLLGGLVGVGNGNGNKLTGNAGNNTLAGRGGANTLVGGAGDDYYIIESTLDVVREAAGDGLDIIEVQWEWGTIVPIRLYLPAHVEVMFATAGYPDSLVLTGNAIANRIAGTAKPDTLDGGAGADTLQGFAGADTYHVDDPADLVIEEASQGDSETVFSTASSWVLPEHVEHLTLEGPALHGTGNDAANHLTGNWLGNRLAGGASNDTLSGGEGNDTLEGGLGDDSIDGEMGLDTAVYAGAQADYVVTRIGNHVTVQGAQGTDILTSIDRLQFADGDRVFNHGPSGSVVIDGTPGSGQTLTARAVGLEDADGVGTLQLDWFEVAEYLLPNTTDLQQLDWNAAVTGETRDLGQLHDFITYGWRVRMQYTDGSGTIETLWSEPLMRRPEDVVHPKLQTVTIAPAPGTSSGQLLVLQFDQPVRAGAEGAVVIQDEAGAWKSFAVDGNRVSFDGNTVTLDLGTDFAPGTRNSFWFNDDAIVSSNGTTAQSSTWSGMSPWFEIPESGTVDVEGPQFDTTRMDDAWSYLSPFLLDFNEYLQRGSEPILLRKADGTLVHSFDVQDLQAVLIEGSSVMLMSSSGIEKGVRYILDVPAGAVLDAAGNPNQSFTKPFAMNVGIDELTDGTSANDVLAGDDRAELLRGQAGNDTLVGAGGDDHLSGDIGIDTAIFRGLRSEYALVKMPAVGVGTSEEYPAYFRAIDQVAGRDAFDTLYRMEHLRFTDAIVDLTVADLAVGIAAQDLRHLHELYVGFFDRIPEAAGLAYWIGELKAGSSLTFVAERFHEAGVSFGVYQAGMDDAGYIAEVYNNLLARGPGSALAPSDSEIGYWSALLQDGSFTRATMVLQMLHDVRSFEGHAVYGAVANLLAHKAALAQYYAVEQGLGRLTPQEDIAFGRQLADLVTAEGIADAVNLIGLGDAAM